MTTTAAPIATWFAGGLTVWYAVGEQNGGAFAIGDVRLRPGDEAPLHVHRHEDELIHVLGGELVIQIGTKRVEAGNGTMLLLPRGVPHGFAVRTASARMLQVYTPAGIERCFQAVAEPADDFELPPVAGWPLPADALTSMVAVFGAHGVEFVGPPVGTLLEPAPAAI
jgi:quercetin dioxygenase-like cupin family protein